MQRPQRFHRALVAKVATGEISKRQLAIAAEISRSHLDKILAGDCVPTLEVADRIADAIGIPLEDMIGKMEAIPA